jgi:type VI secretion system secreted protein VgrG
MKRNITGFAIPPDNTVVGPGSTTGGSGLVTGTIHIADAVAQQAQVDALAAYNNLAGQTPFVNMANKELGGLTLQPGVYRFSSEAQLTGTLYLDANNDPASVFIFQIGSTLITASSAKVVVIHEPENWCHKYWQVGSSATLGTNTEFVGNILAKESITLNTGAKLYGRALALTGAVTLDTNTITVPVCAPFPTPTLSGWGLILLTGLLVSVGLFTLKKSGRLRLG